MSRILFFKREQGPEEKINEYVTNLINLSQQCDLGTFQDSITRDAFIGGLCTRFSYVVEKLLTEDTSTRLLEKAVKIANILASAVDKTQNILEQMKGFNPIDQ